VPLRSTVHIKSASKQDSFSELQSLIVTLQKNVLQINNCA